ncbi:MAG TPA: ATP-grasp domain-containing protein [Pseudolabrys sp.]|nr:ATP-grasp domain-containing protein [Pseudolabrys sp.]
MPPSREPERASPTEPGPVIGLVTDQMDWHARVLDRALAGFGATVVPFDLAACRIETSTRYGLHLPGFGEKLPDAVLVRTLSGGGFEAVTLRLGVLHGLSALNVPVWNNPRAIERCVDKSATSFLLHRAGIPTPATWACESREAAAAIVQSEGGAFVLKPLFGSQGRGLLMVSKPDELPPPAEVAGGVYYLQRFVGVDRGGYHDFRLLVSQGAVIGAMMRHSVHWVTNVKRGGKPIAAVADGVLKELALAAVAAVEADFAGVDILIDAAGQATVIEVNSMPAWSGLQRTMSADIAGVLAADLVTALARRQQRGAAV